MTKPEIVAHRGASRECPENTLAAFRRAVALGADACELDVHRSADGVIIVHHDPVIPGLGAITDLPAARITSEARVGGEPVPTLGEVVDAVGGALRLYIELKGADTVPDTIALLRSRDALTPDRAALHSFDHRLIQEAHGLAPTLARGVLEVSYPVDGTGAARPVGARDLWRQRDFIDDAFVRAVHAEARRVVAWTVNDARLMERFAAWGVDALCTDDVALARATIGS